MTFTVRIVTADNLAQEETYAGPEHVHGHALEVHVPRLASGELVDDPTLHDRVFVISGSGAQSELHRLFPLCIAHASMPSALLPELSMLWVLDKGPFGPFAWRNVYIDGKCRVNDAVAIADTEDTPWDVIVETDYRDCVRYFLGEIEIRDLIAQGQVQGRIAGMSALCWFVENDDMRDRARAHAEQANLLRAWVDATRAPLTATG
jgi:hypothetical protein